MKKFIPVNEPVIKEREKQLLLDCLNSGWVSSEGPFVNEFEEKFSNKVNRKYGIACSSGTAALDIAIKALEIGPGDEVIIPSFTIISCASAVFKSGAKIILLDCDKDSWLMQPDQLEKLITAKTKAIMVVHIYGLPVNIDPIIEIAKKNRIFIIEDSAEQIGGLYKGKPCGSFGDISTFSFYPNKNVTTGEGGMVVTNNINLAERAKSLRNLCFQSEKRFVHNEIGWNYRMTNLQAALGLAQLERLDESVEKKISIGKAYYERLKDIDLIQLPLEKLDYAQNIFWVYGIVLDKRVGNAKYLMKKLADNSIGSRPFFYPIHKQPVFLNKGLFVNDFHPNAEHISEYGFYLPSGLSITINEIDIVTDTLKRLIKEKIN
tara:strand:+ start:53 stop:1180 length:1128 start_codon:yes stop_codon:yes gene_type:complete